MDVAAEELQHLDHVVDVVVEIEAAGRHRHHARVGPVGDVDVMIGQERFDRAAQQRRVVARHRRDDQHARLRLARRPRDQALEIQQLAERPLPDRMDVHRHAHAGDLDILDAPFRLAVAPRGALEQFAAGRDRFAELGVRERIERILKQQLRRIGHGPNRIERRLPHLVHPVERRRNSRCAFAYCGRRAAKFTNRHNMFPKPLLRRSIYGHRFQARQCASRSCNEVSQRFPRPIRPQSKLTGAPAAIRRTGSACRRCARCSAARRRRRSRRRTARR